MDDIADLLSETSLLYFADSQKHSSFDRKIHKKYNAKYYFQVIPLVQAIRYDTLLILMAG